ncbi:3-deoxy-D-manno-octulosonic acid transferase [Starkeya sp. ORNL1]|uniref:3-deoxy-D-manno-octulosonic acid transferase n=1 Tax=Starkeya sp. ORNL1 TaxID=2709380 RepID=UPI0014630EE2|nr:3-deoxy-D-manno-octulosonic acid transferase [Starkeya sp. ORNL1]QJP13998.1 3-deoxy-D-manno-octulosonic acid transferase [Starkeya sp. ORNL1]
MASARGTLLISTYRFATWAATPFARLLLSSRLKRGKEDAARLNERFGQARAPRPKGPLVWLHGASVGEILSLLPLIDRLRGRGFHVLLTSGTVTSARLAEDRLTAGTMHQFVPLDSPVFMRRFLRHWRPNLVLLAESELWPNLITEVNARQIPLVLVNARLSPRSFASWRRLPRSAAALLARVDLCLAQGEGDGQRYAKLGAPRVTVTGNLKFDAPPPPVDNAAFETLRQATAGRPVLVAASTHAGEDEVVIAAHKTLHAAVPDLLTIIAPRHPQRGQAIIEAANAEQVPAVLRSDGYLPDRGTQLYVADTIGELGLFYSLARIALLGRSVIGRGGQNPIEAAKLGAAIVHGPNVGNFEEVYQRLDAANGAITVTDAATLADAARRLLTDEAERARMVAAAQATITSLSGALDRTLAAIDPYLVQIRLERH